MSVQIRRQVTIVNKLGLHARAASKLVTLAGRFESEVLLCRDDKSVNAKSIMGVMMLAASQGATLELDVEGADAQSAVDEIESLIANRFGEPE
ncbi:MAG: phosphocarrier protein HPr [Thiotrichales bacterium]|nr:phosphocarrier protein HPr [Thiotrichales bacterium]|tara:strand:- start:119 stop:397 length:279 start_codon:yes stop_codon:yes gene_type:complete